MQALGQEVQRIQASGWILMISCSDLCSVAGDLTGLACGRGAACHCICPALHILYQSVRHPSCYTNHSVPKTQQSTGSGAHGGSSRKSQK